MAKEPILSENEFGERFLAVGSMMEQSQYDQAAAEIETSFEERVLDVRLVLYYLFIHCMRGGIKVFPEALFTLNTLVGEDWEKLSPTAKREKHAERSVNWFLGRHLKILDGVNRAYDQKKLEPLKEIAAGINDETLLEVNDAVDHLNATFMERWGKGQACNQVMHLRKMVAEVGQIALSVDEEKKEESKPRKLFGKSKKEPQTEDVEEEAPKELKSIQPQTAIPMSALQPSPALEAFYKKIQAFHKLVEKREYQKAAVIAEDIEQKLDNFNPAVYFPKLFVEYYSMYAKHAQNLEGGESNRLLQKLYEADLDAFLSWK